jgi:NhaP-type Na+/H+ or K+/H+ antiporter
VRPESIVYGAVMGLALALLWSRLSGQRLSLRPRRPTIWDLLIIAFAFYMPIVGAVIDNGFVASVVVILTGIALVLAWRRFGQTQTEAAPPGGRSRTSA